MATENDRLLLVVGSNPPTTSGQRTIGRIHLARELLGYSHVALTNLVGIQTYRTTDLTVEATNDGPWIEARKALSTSLNSASAVLLAYGTNSPSGAARQHFSSQIRWLNVELRNRSLPVYMVGGAPRHPSRWQRHTYKNFPDLGFDDALAKSIHQLEFLE